MIRRSTGRGSESGQMLALVALSAAVLIAMVGLGIDLGFAYVTKARLSKACDAAALAGMENINQGTTTAALIAHAEFYANYANGGTMTGLDTAPVSPTFTFSLRTYTQKYAPRTKIRKLFISALGAL
jgi:Flp pilus assembly protein TadG